MLTNIQRCSDIDRDNVRITMLLQGRLNSQCAMNAVLTTLLQCWNINVKPQRLLDISITMLHAPTLHWLSRERKTWTIHGDMVTFPQPCLEVVKKFINNMTFVWYSGLIL